MNTEILGVYGYSVKVRETTWFLGTKERAVRLIPYNSDPDDIQRAFYTDTFDAITGDLYDRLRNAFEYERLKHNPK